VIPSCRNPGRNWTRAHGTIAARLTQPAERSLALDGVDNAQVCNTTSRLMGRFLINTVLNSATAPITLLTNGIREEIVAAIRPGCRHKSGTSIL
jgi:hypothetical protein